MKAAPQTAKLPSVTREMVAQWEAELDEFVLEIQSRLEDVAVSLSAPPEMVSAEFSQEPLSATEFEHFAAIVEPSVPPRVAEQSIAVPHEPVSPVEPVTPVEPVQRDETDDRLQAIKLKLAARLQGE